MQGIAFLGLYLYNNLNDMMRKILYFVCASLLMAGLCGCEKNLFPEIDLANNLF